MKLHTPFLDTLRIASFVAVCGYHVAYRYCTNAIGSLDWFWGISFESLFLWCVPTFVMISGAIFLNPQKDIQTATIYKKNIFRIITALLFWSFIYTLWAVDGGPWDYLNHFIKGHSHLWFLYMIIGLYAITPFLRKIIHDSTLAIYFVGLAFFASFLLPWLFFSFFPHILHIPFYIDSPKIAQNTHLTFTAGYTLYFVMGYLISSQGISNKIRKFLYALGIISFCFILYATFTQSLFRITLFKGFFNFLSIPALFQSLAIFTFFRYNLNFSNKFISVLSQSTFGAYLIHALFLECFDKYLNWTSVSQTSLATIPIMTLIIATMSYTSSLLLRKNSILKRFFT